jgi:hypothetical protein
MGHQTASPPRAVLFVPLGHVLPRARDPQTPSGDVESHQILVAEEDLLMGGAQEILSDAREDRPGEVRLPDRYPDSEILAQALAGVFLPDESCCEVSILFFFVFLGILKAHILIDILRANRTFHFYNNNTNKYTRI